MYRANLVPIGFEIVRNILGERTSQFILKLGRRKKLKAATTQDLTRIGGLVGLNAAEVSATTGIAQAIMALPRWIKALLMIIAIIAGMYVVYNVTYIPGTLYASMKPKDLSD